MEDRLKKIVEEKREEWDDATPGAHIWKQIQMSMVHQLEKKHWYYKISKIAAVGITILSVGIITGIYIGSNRSANMDVATQTRFKHLEQDKDQFARQVNVKLNAINDQESKRSIEADIKNLDEIYDQLRQEMIKSDNANMDLIINAMINNHQTKVEMLEYILQKQNQHKNEVKSIY